MVMRPISFPKWTNGPSSPLVVQPDASLANTGWQPGQAPDAQNVNWLLWDIDQWIEYLDSLVEGGAPNAWMRLINGGTWSLNASTGLLAWSSDFNISIAGVPDSANDAAAGSATLLDGQVMYAQANTPFISQGNTQTGINQITGMNFTANLQVGMSVTGPGIPSSTTVTGVGINFVNLSHNATSPNTGATYIFYNTSSISVVVADESTVIPTPSQILIAKRSGNVIYLGINASQMVLRDGEFKTLIGSGYFSLYDSTAGENLTQGQTVYISPGSSDGGRTAGRVYKLDVSAAHQSVRGTYAGTVITSVSAGQPVRLLYSGFFLGSSLTPGATYYADPTTPGGITSSIPTQAGARIEALAFAVTSTSLLFTGVNAGEPQQFPLFAQEFPVDSGDHQNYALSTTPLSNGAVFVFLDGTLITNDQWSITGTTLTFNTPNPPDIRPYVKYVVGNQTLITAGQEAPVNQGDNVTFNLSGTPMSQEATFVFIDGLELDFTEFSLFTGGSHSAIVLNTPIAPGQKVYAAYFSVNGGGTGPVTGGVSLGMGTPIFKDLFSGNLRFRSIAPGTNISFALVNDTIIISSTGGGGGGGPVAFGSKASPIAVNPTTGFTPSSDMDQVWWVTTTTLAPGADPITANPQIGGGVTVGKRLTVFFVTNGSGGYLTTADGNGLDQNGPVSGQTGQCVVYQWDGGAWSEVTRRI